jgi:hypothetical protein
MDALSILAMAGGVLGLLAFVKVNSLSKQVYLLRSDLKLAATKSEGSGSGGGSCGCGGNC